MRWLVVTLGVWGLISFVQEPASANDTVFLLGTLEDGVVVPSAANRGENAQVNLFYTDPTSNIQGFSMAMCFDCGLTGVEGSYSIEDTFLITLAPEYIDQSVDNDPNDGDGCELIIAVLFDLLPPFDNQTLPPTANPFDLGSFLFFVDPDTECFTTFAVEFCDGVNGSESVPINNVAVINNESIPPSELSSTVVMVPADSFFVRGEINNDGIVDVADVVFLLSFLFLDGDTPACLDAADTDNDSFLTITDSLFLTLYLFLDGLPPPSPFPDCGLEPQPDRDPIDCDGPTATCPTCP